MQRLGGRGCQNNFYFLIQVWLSKDPCLEKKLKDTFNRYFKSEPLGPQHASFWPGILFWSRVEKNPVSVILFYGVLAFQGYHAFCFLSLRHTLTPRSGRQLLFSETDTKYGCVAMLPILSHQPSLDCLSQITHSLWTYPNPDDQANVLLPEKSWLCDMRQVIPGLSRAAFKS